MRYYRLSKNAEAYALSFLSKSAVVLGFSAEEAKTAPERKPDTITYIR